MEKGENDMGQKIEFELSLTTVLAIASVVGVLLGASRWVTKAEVAHESVQKIDEIVDELHQQQKLERELWGDSYRERIHEVLREEEEENRDGDI